MHIGHFSKEQHVPQRLGQHALYRRVSASIANAYTVDVVNTVQRFWVIR